MRHSQPTPCAYKGNLASGSAPSTPARRLGAPRQFRPRGRCGRRRVACWPDMTVRRFATTKPLGSDATPPSSSTTASATTSRRTDTTTTARCRWSATSRCTSGSGGRARPEAGDSKGAQHPLASRNVRTLRGLALASLLTTTSGFRAASLFFWSCSRDRHSQSATMAKTTERNLSRVDQNELDEPGRERPWYSQLQVRRRFRMIHLAAVVVLVVLGASGASAQDRGVLAIGVESARHVFSFSGEDDAVNMCGTADCEVVATFSACLAVAHSHLTARGAPVWTWMEVGTEGDANRGAQDECEDAGGLGCAVLNTYCLDGANTAAAAQQATPAATPEQENLFWQSIMERTNPAMFEAYLAQFPGGVFRALTEARLAELRAPADNAPGGAVSRRADTAGSPGSGSRPAGGADAPRRPGEVFRDCYECPEMVVMPGGGLALGRYEVTVGEYRAFASATGGGGDAWRDPDFGRGFEQTDRHPVTRVSWDDAKDYVSWLSRTAGETYRLPTEAEWEGAAAGSQRGCDRARTGNGGTCPVGSYGLNAAGLSDMGVTYGSGRRTAGSVTAVAMCCAAAPGTTVPRTSVPARATRSTPAAGTTSSGFVLRGRLIRSCVFRSLPLGGAGGRSPPAPPAVTEMASSAGSEGGGS